MKNTYAVIRREHPPVSDNHQLPKKTAEGNARNRTLSRFSSAGGSLRSIDGSMEDNLMLAVFARKWWVLALRAVVAVLFGVAVIIWPAIALKVIVLLFGVYALVDGIVTGVLGVLIRPEEDRWWLWLLEGLTGIVIGVLVFVWPAISTLVLLYLIATWGLVSGVMEILAAIRLRKVIQGEWVLMLDGFLSILLGAFLIVYPNPGILVLIWMIGIYAILFGLLLFILSLQLRSLGRTLQREFTEVS